MATLSQRPSDGNFDFASGKGYIQHDRKTWDTAVSRLRALAISLAPGDEWAARAFAEGTHESHGGRVISEYSSLRGLSSAWYRVSCVDPEYREWGQPYYANMSYAARSFAVCLNPPTETTDSED